MECVVVTGDFVPTGGMDRANLALASYLARTGHRVSLVAHRVDQSLQNVDGVAIHSVAKPLGSYLLGGPLLSQRGCAVAATASQRGGRVIVNGGNCAWPDVNWVHYVHHAYRPRTQSAGVRAALASVKAAGFRRAERRAFRMARSLIANSQRTKRDIIDASGVDAARVRVVYYGNDAGVFKPASDHERRTIRAELGLSADEPVFVFIGALGDDRKGFDTLFAAWRALMHSGARQAKLLVIGEGAETDLWRQRTNAEQLSESVRFLGFRRDVPRILQAVDAAISPARYEAYGLAVQEALCCGLPAIVSASAGVAERISGAMRDLLLERADDSRALARTLSTLLDNPDSFRRMALDLSDSLRRYSWDDMSRDIVEAMTT